MTNTTNTISRLFGAFAGYAFPKWFQIIINKVYVWIFKIDLSDFAPLDSYPTLNALFTRALIVKRELDSSLNVLISPTDSVIMAQGEVRDDMALQIKGMEYRVSELLGENLDSTYSYINLYLSPRDYHRYHCPCDMEILEVRYFGGVLLPVNQPSLRKNQNLFIKNERVVVIAKTKNNTKLYFVAIGALNVGQMIFHFEPKITTNAKANTKEIYTYPTPIKVKKGEELGMFMMGSTIVLFASNITLTKNTHSQVRFGEKIDLLS